MPYLTMRDNQPLYVRTLGKGRPCLVLHGFGMHSGHWLPFLAPLATRHRFIIPDLRGFGRSHETSYNQACVLTNNAEDIEDTLNLLKIPKVDLAGLSLGAFTALQLHRMGGFDRVNSYLHIDQSPLVLNNDSWKWGIFGHDSEARMQRLGDVLSVAREFRSDTRYEKLPLWLRKAMWKELGKFADSATRYRHQKALVKKVCNTEALIKKFMPIQNWSVYTDCLHAYLHQDYDMRPYLSTIDVPVTIMTGRHSEMYPWQGQVFMQHQIPNARMVMFEKSGHIPLVNEPLKFTYELAKFLRRSHLATPA